MHRPRALWPVVALLGVATGATGASCNQDAPPRPPCDDTVVTAPVQELPGPMRDRGLTRAAGAGDIWFIAPGKGRWGDLMSARDSGLGGKFPLWVGTSLPPSVEVVGVDGTQGTGTAHLAPTAEGLPGPLPMAVWVPRPGCWMVRAFGVLGQAAIVVNARMPEAAPPS